MVIGFISVLVILMDQANDFEMWTYDHIVRGQEENVSVDLVIVMTI